MSNPLFNALGGGMPQGNGPMQMIQQFMQFKQNFKGDPKEEVEKMLQSDVVFSNTAVKGSNCIQHREGSGIITLRGLTNQCKARFFVDFSGNIAIPTGGTVGAISLAIAISGEPVLSSQMISTPAAVDQYNNVSSGIYIDVPRGCCVNIAVENTSDQAVSVANANIVVTREA